MGEIINLNRFRKTKARQERESEAAANRVKFGRTKAEKQLTIAEQALADKRLSGLRRAAVPAEESASPGKNNGQPPEKTP